MKPNRTATGHWLWRDRRDGVEIRFVGRGPGDRAAAAAAAAAPGEVAWARQLHSARILEAVAGCCGEGDALIGDRAGLALSVVTADCVPVLLAGGGRIAAVHAGWRGIAAGIVRRVVERLGRPAGSTAWIGPAIGPCCYEVGDDVAARVAAASDAGVVVAGGGDRPHLDLVAAVAGQLERAGVERIHAVRHCTRCDPERLWSYRREGPGAGRNVSLVWLRR